MSRQMNDAEKNRGKTWRDLEPQQVDHFYKLLAARASSLGEGAHSWRLELSKYLFAANTGAAAGLFLLLRASPGGRSYLWAFFLFCLGTFFVGLSYFLAADWGHEMAKGWSRDFERLMRNEITLGQLDHGHAIRSTSRKFWLLRTGLWLSFACLLCGGITAAKPFWSQPQSKPAINVSQP
jgi:hypothetical protein